jgi:tRNA-modifying protein YgfZ
LDIEDMVDDHNRRMLEQPSPTAGFDGIVRLSDWGVIRARGADAANFLHGQLTQDITHLDSGHARLAGYCTAKGRLLATFVVWRVAEEEILLACSADLLPATLKRLSMFVLRAKCKLTDASAELLLHGLAGASAMSRFGASAPTTAWQCAAQGAGRLIRLPDADGIARFLWAGGADAPPPPLPALSPEDWSWLEVRSGVARVTAATTEQFVPQMLNLELLGGVNFQKGCYPGQEVVARSQYRGTLKRRTCLMETATLLSPGTEVFHDLDPSQPAGMAVLAATGPGGRHAALVELKLTAADGGTLHAGAPDGPDLVRVPLPYTLDAQAA